MSFRAVRAGLFLCLATLLSPGLFLVHAQDESDKAAESIPVEEKAADTQGAPESKDESVPKDAALELEMSAEEARKAELDAAK